MRETISVRFIPYEAIRQYLGEIEAEYTLGNATEHSYRPALKKLIESHGKTIHAVNEPRRVECGAPDFEVSHATLKVGYIEAKDIGKSLDEVAKGFPKFIVDEASSFVAHAGDPRSAATRQDAASTLGRVQINREQYFDGVPYHVWNFTIGGYRVCENG